MSNFWKDIKKPVFSLAPMEDVTDTSFREIVLALSDPEYLQVIFTEFTSTNGLCHEKGRPNVISRLEVNDSERILLQEKNVKLVAQIWGPDPENHFKSAKIVSDMGFEGIDINMGCPIKKIVKQGGCSALIANPELAGEIIQATQEGSSLPVSVKTRIGLNKVITEEWISHLLKYNLAALTVHGRTQKMQSEGLADWNEIAKAVQLRNEIAPETLIFGNGDVMSAEEGLAKCETHQLDGVMIGRGIFKTPWFFNANVQDPSIKESLDVLWRHVSLFTKTWEGRRNFAIQKRFFKIYINNFKGAAELRASLMETNNIDEVEKVIEQYREQNQV
ncbi:MAG: tRNA-dihydrouridine synthase [Bacteroidetes bacterium]|jgi:nifR3 family TIM-barrel protein|nr:tRNA-dihydrouridine synthase [Bacteroidota bacterium]MBT5529294.1 tRNA-dihydrouridine synthase [Cytophagia bacterium]MBT4338910.1 tRNA-dihydrouridine synthase [Bacteroidota bacterium]MBT5991096.1 tRNA-dihydrouridine synthase [Bacteroidota bacterium]MBT6834947.1 tRNA-dihydrouridine synthase [Bacteroidota bacterium]